MPVIIHDDVEQAADYLRPMYALYFGGMGARGANFHHDVAVRLGYDAEAKRIQDLYLDGKKDEAAAAVPTQLVEELALIGPEDKIRDDLEAWRESIVTTLVVGGDAATLRRIAGLVLGLTPRSAPPASSRSLREVPGATPYRRPDIAASCVFPTTPRGRCAMDTRERAVLAAELEGLADMGVAMSAIDSQLEGHVAVRATSTTRCGCTPGR